MHILIISYYFPPYNTIGAVRVGKTAKHLAQLGHDIRVIAAKSPTLEQPDMSLPVELPPEHVHYMKWISINSVPKILLRPFRHAGNDPQARSYVSSLEVMPGPLRTFAHFYLTLVNFPDAAIGWLPFALRGATQILKEWQPDLIYASGLPATAFVVAYRLSRRAGIPWVADLRDLWADNANYLYLPWRRRIDDMLERRVLGTAAGLVTVSGPLADVLKAKYGKPTAVVMNGYDPIDSPAHPVTQEQNSDLHIVYTGQFYRGFQDPLPLFQAIKRLGAGSGRVRVDFYLRSHLAVMQEMIDQVGVQESVHVREPVPYDEARRLQLNADLLLLLLWSGRSDQGILTGKLFEYIGARRPILAIGQGDEYTAKLISERGLGRAMWQPDQIARELQSRLQQKSRGGIPPLPEQVAPDLSRKQQIQVLDAFLRNLISPGGQRAHAP